jgi:hypothetical protein
MVHRICQEKSLSFFIVSIIADYFEPSIIEKAGGSIHPMDKSQVPTGPDVGYDAILDIIVSHPHRTYHEITDFH